MLTPVLTQPGSPLLSQLGSSQHRSFPGVELSLTDRFQAVPSHWLYGKEEVLTCLIAVRICHS